MRCGLRTLIIGALAALAGAAATHVAAADRSPGLPIRGLRAPLLRESAVGGQPLSPLLAGDYDADGVADDIDNCPFNANAAQTDTDRDGLGDTCDAFPNGGLLAFGPEHRLPEPDSSQSLAHVPVDLDVDVDGRAFVLLATLDPASLAPRNLWLARSDDAGDSWNPAVRVNTDDRAWLTWAEAAIDDQGRIFVVWDREDGSVVLARSLDHGASFTLSPIAGADRTGGFVTVATDRNAMVYVAYDTDYDCALSRVALRKSTNAGASFEAVHTITPLGTCMPQLVVSANRDMHLSHSDQAVAGLLAVATSRDQGGSFGAPVPVLDAPVATGTELYLPAPVRESTTGNLHTGWVLRDPVNDSFVDQFADRSLDGGAAFELDLQLTSNDTHVDAALKPGGLQWQLATRSDGLLRRVLIDGTVYSRRVMIALSTDGGESYSALQPATVPLFGWNESYPVVGLSRDGETLVAYARAPRSGGLPAATFCARTGAHGPVDETLGLRFAAGSRSEIAWSAVANASRYDVTRGSIATLRITGSFASALDYDCGVTGVSTQDASTPFPGEGVYYLVRARNPGAIGTWGTAQRDTEIAACP